MELIEQKKSERAICTLCYWDGPVSGKKFRVSWIYKNRVDQWTRHNEQFETIESARKEYEFRVHSLTERGFYATT